jgi:probable phosphoglycerate mutase
MKKADWQLRPEPGPCWSEAMPARLVVLRHGATEWSQNGQHTGRTDIPLLEEGCRQAEAAGEFLRAEGLDHFDLVLTSPLRRASETCDLAGFGGRAEADPDLVEWDYGEYEGLTTPEIRQRVPGWTLWDNGVPAGERVSEVGRRADRVIARALAHDGDTLCVAHGHLLRVLAARWLGLPPVAGRLFVLNAGALGRLDWDKEFPVMERWNVLPAASG